MDSQRQGYSWEGSSSIDLDIELQTMHLIQGHLFEQRSSRLQQILLGRIGDKVDVCRATVLVTRLLGHVTDGIPVVLPGSEHHEIPVGIAPLERFAAKLCAWKAVQQANISQKEE